MIPLAGQEREIFVVDALRIACSPDVEGDWRKMTATRSGCLRGLKRLH